MEEKYRGKLPLLRKWRSIARSLAMVIKKLYPEAEVYLIGGAAEGRITVNSDIDIAVVFNRDLSRRDRVEILARIWDAADAVTPMYYPLELHILTPRELAKLEGRKVKLS